jgi:hypothetical protein
VDQFIKRLGFRMDILRFGVQSQAGPGSSVLEIQQNSSVVQLVSYSSVQLNVYPDVGWPRNKDGDSPLSLPRLRICGSVFPHPHTPSNLRVWLRTGPTSHFTGQ